VTSLSHLQSVHGLITAVIYNHAAHSVSSSTTLAFLNDMREKHKSTSPSAIQVKLMKDSWY